MRSAFDENLNSVNAGQSAQVDTNLIACFGKRAHPTCCSPLKQKLINKSEAICSLWRHVIHCSAVPLITHACSNPFFVSSLL
uniref:Uncharacterized protein n=1 Tax=Anguilla anguilla TaxID=7936 RepID=A0A0E9WQF5_ANGAN